VIVFINNHYMPGVSLAGTTDGKIILAEMSGRLQVEVYPSADPLAFEAMVEGRKCN
jgi:hypothetical protein